MQSVTLAYVGFVVSECCDTILLLAISDKAKGTGHCTVYTGTVYKDK